MLITFYSSVKKKLNDTSGTVQNCTKTATNKARQNDIGEKKLAEM